MNFNIVCGQVNVQGKNLNVARGKLNDESVSSDVKQEMLDEMRNVQCKSKCQQKSSKIKISGRSQKIVFVLFSSMYSPYVDMKCDIVFSRLKRFKFEKIKTNELRPDYGQICRTQWLKPQFAFACQKEPKLPDTFA